MQLNCKCICGGDDDDADGGDGAIIIPCVTAIKNKYLCGC